MADSPDPVVLTKLADAMMWALGTLDAIARLESAFSVGQRYRREGAPGPEAVRDANLERAYRQNHVIWAANQLVTAWGRLKRETRIKVTSTRPQMLRVVERLRDVLEHWDNTRDREDSGALRRLTSVDPAAAPWTLHWQQGDGTTLANSVQIDELRSWAREVLTTCEAELEAADPQWRTRIAP